MKLKLYGILSIIVIAVGLFVSRYINNHSFVSDKFIKQKVDSIFVLKKNVSAKDSLLFSCQQTSDIRTKQVYESQIVLAELNKQLQQAKNDAKRANEAIEHYENAGLMRYFVFDKRGIFKKGCYQEVFEKPDNICK